jgi:hypothetical protein
MVMVRCPVGLIGQKAGHGPDDGLGGVPDEWVRGVNLLYLARGPRDVPTHRWRQFVSDCQNFMISAEKWAARAAEIGWTTESLFGCYWSRPLDHLGSAAPGLGRDRGSRWRGACFP